jgi:TRAP-type C4-dicarboxylate transport system permease small subunit
MVAITVYKLMKSSNPSILGRFYRFMDICRNLMIVLALAVTVVLCTIEILGRHLDVFRWGGDLEELIRYLSVWVVFLGASVAFRRGSHFHVDYFQEKFFAPETRKRVVKAVSIVIAAFLLMLIWYGAIKAFQNLDQNIKSAPIPFAVFYLAIPIGSAYMLLDLLLVLVFGRHPFVAEEGDAS